MLIIENDGLTQENIYFKKFIISEQISYKLQQTILQAESTHFHVEALLDLPS